MIRSRVAAATTVLLLVGLVCLQRRRCRFCRRAQQAVLARVSEGPDLVQAPGGAGHVVAVNNELSYASPHAHLTFLEEVQESLTLLAGGR